MAARGGAGGRKLGGGARSLRTAQWRRRRQGLKQERRRKCSGEDEDCGGAGIRPAGNKSRRYRVTCALFFMMTCSSGEERSGTFHLAVANRCNFSLLHALLLREFAKESLRVLCSKMGQLLGSSSAELIRSALLCPGFLRSWAVAEHARNRLSDRDLFSEASVDIWRLACN